jgi:D-alanyl-D-alanine carboxypeptidase (penicillin-binding protein 5/6)
MVGRGPKPFSRRRGPVVSASRIRTAAVACFLAASIALAVPASALGLAFPAPKSKMPAGILMTMDGTVLWSRKADVRRQTASTIKLLNALVLREQGVSLDTTVTVPKHATKIHTGAVGLYRGQQLTIRQLLEMMLIASANDAAATIGIRVGGSEQAYVALMNAKAASLGLTNTFATDTNGLNKRQRSTARDLSVLARRVMADPELRAIVTKPFVVVPRKTKAPRTFRSTDLLLGAYPGIEGVKTGFTNPAGYCFIGAALRGDVELLGVVLGTRSNKARFKEMRRMLDWGFANTHLQTLVSTEITMGAVAIDGFPPRSVTVHAGSAFTKVMLDGSFDTTVTLPSTVTAPVSRGQRLGTYEVGRDGVTLATVPLLADSDVAVSPIDVRRSALRALRP